MELTPFWIDGAGPEQKRAYITWLGLNYDDWRATDEAFRSGSAWDRRISEISAFDQEAAQRLRQAASGYQTNPWGAVWEFADIYNDAISRRKQEAHQRTIAELERQRQAAEAAAARHSAWQSNMTLQNRQNENLPDTIAGGTASGGAVRSGSGEVGGDVGGKPRLRRRGSLSSNLGIIT